MSASESPIQVLYVGDDSSDTNKIGDALERADSRLEVETATSVAEGLDRLASEDIDSIVSGYDLSGQNGIEFLETVREEYLELPFILYTDKGSEEVASAAISAGATEYFRKDTETEQHAKVANCIRNAVGEYRARRAEESSERQLPRVYERITDGFFAVNSDWEYTYVNEEGSDLVDRSKADLLGTTVWDAFPELVGTPFEEALRTAMEAKTQTSTQEYYPAHERWYDVTIYPATDGVSIYFRDVTDRKERERRFQLERNRFRALFENLGEPVVEVVFDDETPRIKRVNDAFVDAFGIGEDHYGESLDAAIVPDGDETAAQINGQAKAGNQVEREVYRGSTDVHPYLFRSAPFMTPENRQRGHGIYIDISERKQQEQELERQNERLEQFTNMVTHDLRNPLNVAQGRLELLHDESENEHLDAIARAHERMEALISDLLTLAHKGQEASDLESVKLAMVAEDCWQTVATAEATLNIDSEQSVRADRSRLRQLLENLIRNAVEHSGEEATVTVSDLEDGFYVADDGPGIPEDDREQVFNPGYSTTGDGTGFGLMIVQDICKAHGWEVTVTENEGGGARFDITGTEFADC